MRAINKLSLVTVSVIHTIYVDISLLINFQKMISTTRIQTMSLYSDNITTRVRDKKSLVKVGNLVKNLYLYR